MKTKRTAQKLLILSIALLQFGFLFFAYPNTVDTAPLTAASATLGNSRLSYKAGVSGAISSGESTIDIDSSGNPDNDTTHLFPNDTVCFPDADENGCSDETLYTVNSITDADTFTMSTALAGALETDDLVISTQSGSLTLTFTTATLIPSDGDILITIPAIDHATKPCDGIPDHSSAVATNGFDLGDAEHRVAAADISTTGCTDGDWVATETVTCGNAGADHTIRIDRQNTTCSASSTVTVTVDSSPGLRNPAPITSGHTQGQADIYTINVLTRDGADTTIDSIDLKVAPIEGVHVSATVDDTLAFTVAGITADSGSYCGITRDASSPDTTATSVPFGTVSDADDFTDTNHQLTVSTNGDGGYTVYVEENDELGLDGATSPFIADTPCDSGPCTHQTAQDWNTATNYGFGYSMEDVSGTDATFEYNDSGTFYAKQFPNIAGGDGRDDSTAHVMSNSGPVSGSSAYMCYRLNVAGVQEAGTYFNNIKYTAVPSF